MESILCRQSYGIFLTCASVFVVKWAIYAKKHKKSAKKAYDFQYFVKMKHEIYVMQHDFGINVVILRAFLGQREIVSKIALKIQSFYV